MRLRSRTLQTQNQKWHSIRWLPLQVSLFEGCQTHGYFLQCLRSMATQKFLWFIWDHRWMVERKRDPFSLSEEHLCHVCIIVRLLLCHCVCMEKGLGWGWKIDRIMYTQKWTGVGDQVWQVLCIMVCVCIHAWERDEYKREWCVIIQKLFLKIMLKCAHFRWGCMHSCMRMLCNAPAITLLHSCEQILASGLKKACTSKFFLMLCEYFAPCVYIYISLCLNRVVFVSLVHSSSVHFVVHVHFQHLFTILTACSFHQKWVWSANRYSNFTGQVLKWNCIFFKKNHSYTFLI